MHKHLTTALFAGAVLTLCTLGGCAGLDASNERSLLAAAGFHARTPETPKQRELYAAAPAHQVQRVAFEGRVFYVFKDEKNGVAYVGGEAEYQRYQLLAVQKHIAASQYQAAEMNRQAAMGWSGAYGSYALGPRLHRLR
jgi:hypothetical protein